MTTSPPPHILIVDDERDLLELLDVNLRKAGYRVTSATNGREALTRMQADRPDLAVVDVMMPEINGIELVSRVRSDAKLSGLPMVMLTAKGEEVDELVGLSVGADDYIAKPFSMKVLLARIAAILRRIEPTGESDEDSQVLGPIRINGSTHEAMLEGEPMHLTLTEFRVLASLLDAEGRVLSRGTLIAKAIGPGITVTERTIDVHVTAIRKKLGRHASLIQTVRGVGYRASLQPEPAGEA